MKRALLLTQMFPPETGAGANRLDVMANSLDQVLELTVICPKPSYPSPTLYSKPGLLEADHMKPFRIFRTASLLRHAGSFVKRALRELRMCSGLVWRARSIATDCVITSSPSMFLILAAYLVSRIKKVELVIDVRDLTWRYVQESVNPSLAVRLLAILLERMLIWCLQEADLVSCATSGIRDYLVREGVSQCRCTTISNGVSQSYIDLFGDIAEDHGLGIVSYVGLFGHNHGVETVLDVAKKMPNIKFRLVGDGPARGVLEQRISREGIDNVELIGYVTDRSVIRSIYENSDILINFSKDRQILNETVIGAKTYEYMATGRPMVFAGAGITASLIREVGCGIVTPPDSPESIVSALQFLVENPAVRNKMGQLGRAHVCAHYVREQLMSSLADSVLLLGPASP